MLLDLQVGSTILVSPYQVLFLLKLILVHLKVQVTEEKTHEKEEDIEIKEQENLLDIPPNKCSHTMCI